MITKCPSCQADVPDGSVYCPVCGTRLEASSTTASGSPPEASNPPAQGTARMAPRAASPNAGGDKEHELWSGGYSPKAMLGPALGAALLTVALLVAGGLLSADSMVWIVIAVVIVLAWAWLGVVLACRRLGVSYRLTDQRLVHKSGILRRTTDRIEVIDMDDITFEQDLVSRLIGIGTIRIKSSDISHPEFLMKGIDQVERVSNLVDKARRDERVRRGLHVESI